MRYLFRPPGTDGAELLTLPWHEPLEEWDPALLPEVPQRGISRHVVRFVAARGQGFAPKEISESPARAGDARPGACERAGVPGDTGGGA